MHLITLLACLFFSPMIAVASVHEDHPYEFKIRIDANEITTYFQIDTHNTYLGSVKKGSDEGRTRYDLSDENHWQGTAIRRAITILGNIFTWAAEFDLYDTHGNKFGMIDGQAGTTEHAKFSLYDYDSEGNYTLIGIVYQEPEYNSFIIQFPDHEDQLIAKLEHYTVSINGPVDFWKVKVFHPEQIDDRMIRLFAAFVVDNQQNFRKPEVINFNPILEDEFF